MFCRICLEENEPFISPCRCRGTTQYVHQHCMERWLSTNKRTQCEVCHYTFRFQPLPVIQTLLQKIFTTVGFCGLASIYSMILCLSTLALEYTQLPFCGENDFACDFYFALIIYSTPQYLFQLSELICRRQPIIKKLHIFVCLSTLYSTPIIMCVNRVDLSVVWCVSLILYYISLYISVHTMDPPVLLNYT
jgi:hypothetical protein